MPKATAAVKKTAAKPSKKTTAVKPAKKTTFEDVWLAIRETQASIKETQASMDRAIKETQASVKETQVSIGRLGNRLGDVMESIMVPDLVAKFAKLGYNFNRISRNHKIKDGEHNLAMELDALLENGDCAMAVEVKVTLSAEDVKDHIIRMEKLREYAALRGDNRKFYAAMAAAVVSEDAKTFTLKQGFYVIEVSGENIKITEPFDKPKAF